MMTRKENAEIYEKFYRDTNRFISETEKKIHEAQAKLGVGENFNWQNFDEYAIIEDMAILDTEMSMLEDRLAILQQLEENGEFDYDNV